MNKYKLNLRKIINAAKIYLSYYLSVIFKNDIRYGFPVSLSIEPTTSCNLRCKECPSGQRSFSRPTGNLDLNFFTKIIDEFSPYLLNLILYFQGEPFLNKNFFEMVEYASINKDIFTTTSTNGHYLSEENSEKIIKSGLDKIIISLDGINQQSYENYRVGGNLETVISGIKTLVATKKRLKSKLPYIELQFLVVRQNEHQINDIKKIAKELGVNSIKLKSAQIYEYKNGNDLIPTISKYSRYKKNKDGTFLLKNKLKNKCSRLWDSTVITWDGKVLPCCFDKDAEHVLGDLNIQEFSEINNNEKYKDFRKKIKKGRKNINICKNCTEGLSL